MGVRNKIMNIIRQASVCKIKLSAWLVNLTIVILIFPNNTPNSVICGANKGSKSFSTFFNASPAVTLKALVKNVTYWIRSF
jgi:hypothetical protein